MFDSEGPVQQTSWAKNPSSSRAVGRNKKGRSRERKAGSPKDGRLSPLRWCPSADARKVRLTHLVRTYCLSKGYVSRTEYVNMCVAE